jgi:hypothetical protein
LSPSNRTGAIPSSPTKCLFPTAAPAPATTTTTTTAKTDRGPFRSRRQARRDEGPRRNSPPPLGRSTLGPFLQVAPEMGRRCCPFTHGGPQARCGTQPFLLARGSDDTLDGSLRYGAAKSKARRAAARGQHHTRAALRSRRGRLGWRDPLCCRWGTGLSCPASSSYCCATTGGIRRRVPTKRRNKRTPPHHIGSATMLLPRREATFSLMKVKVLQAVVTSRIPTGDCRAGRFHSKTSKLPHAFERAGVDPYQSPTMAEDGTRPAVQNRSPLKIPRRGIVRGA